MSSTADSVLLLDPRELSAHATARGCELLRGAPTMCFLAGAAVEAAVRWNDHFVVFTSDDVPHEDRLHVTVLDQALRVPDVATIGRPAVPA